MINFIIKSILFNITAIFLPIIAFFVPITGLKKYRTDQKREILISHSIVAVLMGILFSYTFAIYYIVVYVGIEIVYRYLNDNNFNLTRYEKITISALIFTAIIGLYVKTNINELREILNETKNMYVSHLNFEKKEIDLVMESLDKFFLSVVFVYFFFENYMIYLVMNRDNYENWNLNYYLLVPYIILFFFEKILGIKNFYIINFLLIIRVPYVFYGIKEGYTLLEKIIKNKFLRSVIVIFLAMISYNLMFILGSIRSFKLTKEGKKHESDITRGC